MKVKFKKIVVPSILVIALVAIGIWGGYQYKLKEEYEIVLNNSYQRLFYDLKAHVENVQVSLSKVLLAESKEQNVLLLTKIMQEAYSAEEKLGQMPVSHSDIAKTEKFLNQVADYSFAIAEDSLEGKPIDAKNREALVNLQNYTDYLSKELSELHKKIADKNFSFGAVKRKERRDLDKTNENMLNTRLIQLEEKMTETPELIYDGPFSDQVTNVKPKGLGDKTVSAEEAEKIAKEFMNGNKVAKISMFEEGEQMNKTARIPAYTFSITMQNGKNSPAIYISVSKTGGKVVWMTNTRAVTEKKLSVQQAQDKAQKFLEDKGYKSMEPNYSLKYDGTVLFNFALEQNGVTIYPDLIKVKIALDSGEVVGYDAAQFLKAHYKRDIPQPQISKEEARGRVKTNFDIENVRLAIIPKSSLEEQLCYEFKGKYQGSDFIVYVNALTGQETKILKIIKNENGTLTF